MLLPFRAVSLVMNEGMNESLNIKAIITISTITTAITVTAFIAIITVIIVI